MPAEPKYITVNGVLMKNPAYGKKTNTPIQTQSTQAPPLAVISSVEDLMEASTLQQSATGLPIQQAVSTAASTDIIQDPVFLSEFRSPEELEGGEILDKLGEEFAKYETPMGMMNKLLGIKDRHLNFIIDDSGSMGMKTDVALCEATPYVLRQRSPSRDVMMTRWEEAEDRLHIMVDLLAFIPTRTITLSFLNAPRTLEFTRAGKTPDEFQAQAHAELSQTFQTLRPTNGTPSLRALSRAFASTQESAMHYFLTDGAPSDGSPEELAQLIINRRNPEQHPITLISCTNNDKDTDWMKLVDGRARCVAEVDDFNDEKAEILKKQGPGLPYTKGLWILCHLAASINPDDLDALDENLPLTKSTLDNILGRKLTPAEYQYYFEKNPNAALYVNEYAQFLNESLFARQIISKPEQLRRESLAGYRNGFPAHPFPPIDRDLDSRTREATSLIAGIGFMAASAAPPSYAESKHDTSAVCMGGNGV
jgi:hypothetical protein